MVDVELALQLRMSVARRRSGRLQPGGSPDERDRAHRGAGGPAGFRADDHRRLGVLLAHHDPVEALRRRRRPSAAASGGGADAHQRLASAWRGRPSAGRSDDWAERCARSRHRRRTRAIPTTPTCCDRSATARRAVLAGRLVGSRGRRAVSSGRETPPARPRLRRDARLPSRRADVAVVSGTGQGDRRRRPPWALRAGGHAVGVVANGSTRRIRGSTPTSGRRWPANGLLLSEWPPGTEPERFRVPAAQPHPRRAQRAPRGGREPRRGGSLITARGAGALDRGDG